MLVSIFVFKIENPCRSCLGLVTHIPDCLSLFLLLHYLGLQ